MANDPVVRFEDVSFSYERGVVLSAADFQISKGEIVSVVGPNGGGKTTLLKLMLGLVEPDSGRVRVLGDAPRRTRHRIGYMPQHARHDPQFPVTVMDVVLMGRVERHWGGPFSREDREMARASLAEVGLTDHAGRPFAWLSGGERQRVMIARALATDPEILALDEPMASLDVAVEERFYDILRELNRRMTIIMVTHDLDLVSDLVGRVICVNRKVVVHATREITGSILREMYGVDVLHVRHDRRHGTGGLDHE